MKPTRILVADDHPIVRAGVAALILTHRPGWEICGNASDGEEAVAKAFSLRPDIVIMDDRMPLLHGLAAAARVKEQLPTVEVLLFSDTDWPPRLLKIYRSRVRGCLLKSEEAEELLPALEALRRHHHFRSRQITALYEQITAGLGEIETLSARETEVLRHIAEGLFSKQIAAKLGVSAKTIETHRSNLRHKLQLHSTIDLARYALRVGLVEL